MSAFLVYSWALVLMLHYVNSQSYYRTDHLGRPVFVHYPFREDERCSCDECGTSECNNFNSVCLCKFNVVGERCDRCQEGYWGFNSCQGCEPCECPAGTGQCDPATGRCQCNPGVTGEQCDRCSQGYWNYTQSGCSACNCHHEYSVGQVCDQFTGQCDCHRGLSGRTCEPCPRKSILIEGVGCRECGGCVLNLFQVIDELNAITRIAVSQIQTFESSHFIYRKLHLINESYYSLEAQVDQLIPNNRLVIQVEEALKDLEYTSSTIALRKSRLLRDTSENNEAAEDVNEKSLQLEISITDANLELELLVRYISDVVLSLEYGTGAQMEQAIREAMSVINILRRKSFSGPSSLAIEERELARVLLQQVLVISREIKRNIENFGYKESDVREMQEKLRDLDTHIIEATSNSRDTLQIVQQYREASVEGMLESIRNNIKMATDLMDEGDNLNQESTVLVQRISQQMGPFTDGNPLDAIYGELRKFIINLSTELENLTGLINRALAHPDDLQKQAAELDAILQYSRHVSINAIDAANSYKRITEAIQTAYQAATQADQAAQDSLAKCTGIGNEATLAFTAARSIVQQAASAVDEVRLQLHPELEAAKAAVYNISSKHLHNQRELQYILSQLQHIHGGSLASRAIEVSLEANELAQAAMERIMRITATLPEDLRRAKLLYDQLADINIKHSLNQVASVRAMKPEMLTLIHSIKQKQEILKIKGTDVRSQLDELREKIKRARDETNRIEVGVTCFPDSTLQLKNPVHLPSVATTTDVKMYFNTKEPNGLLMYLGNTPGTHHSLRRTNTDDYLSLEVINGYVTLKMDLGSGVATLSNDELYVSDGMWYEVHLRRTGKLLTLKVRTERADKTIVEKEVEGSLPGSKSVLNLDVNLSKFFVCGIPDSVEIQDTIQFTSFSGDIEEVSINSLPVGLWNFKGPHNHIEGVLERDTLVRPAYTGVRFMGEGFSVLPTQRLSFSETLSLVLKFKTSSPEGLMFLVEGDQKFASLEMKDGRIQFQYDLGDGVTILKSSSLYNDGQWHRVEATRYLRDAVLKVDGDRVDRGTSLGYHSTLEVYDQMYFGGYPGSHNHETVTKTGFDGCIDEVQITERQVDLSKPTMDYRIIPGCPAKMSTVISFLHQQPGYVVFPSVPLQDGVQVTFKFRTTVRNGLLFYMDGPEQKLSVSLEGGILVTTATPGGVVQSQSSLRFYDQLWHYVTLILSKDQLIMEVDDFEFNRLSVSVGSISSSGLLYFGGLPPSHPLFGTSSIDVSFWGCLADVTVDILLINFAKSQTRIWANLDICPFLEQQQNITTTTPAAPTVAPTPWGPSLYSCALPLEPDDSEGDFNGLKFNSVSRIEYNTLPDRIRKEYGFSVSIKTLQPNGIIFYTENDVKSDFIALYMVNGKLIHAFNCGSGKLVVESDNQYNDGHWHQVDFFRNEKRGGIYVDDELEGEGESPGRSRSINTNNRYYVGSVPEDKVEEAANNLNGLTDGFDGCLRDFWMGRYPLTSPVYQSPEITPCSQHVEDGAFFPLKGGYIRAFDTYHVGSDEDISIEIKPRTPDGLLLAVYGQTDKLILELINGSVKFTVNNGQGDFVSVFAPPNEFLLCDGRWHKIEASKSGNLLSLAVDTVYVEPGFGTAGIASADTNYPLYIGGQPEFWNLQAEQYKAGYVGCMRNLILDGESYSLENMQVFGDVNLKSCPTL